MKDIMYNTFKHYLNVNKQLDGVALSVFQKESIITIRKIILIL